MCISVNSSFCFSYVSSIDWESERNSSEVCKVLIYVRGNFFIIFFYFIFFSDSVRFFWKDEYGHNDIFICIWVKWMMSELKHASPLLSGTIIIMSISLYT